MARAAVLGRLTWQVAQVVDLRDETATARTLVLDVPSWPGHRAGQHVDVRLTAEDGYSTQRSYSIASAAGADRIELTVQSVDAGEVSPYLARDLAVGDVLEMRGPVGGWFVWEPGAHESVLLVAGGSGIVPLMSMVRTRAAAGDQTPFTLIYSVRTRVDALFADDLDATRDVLVNYIYTREAPPGASVLPPVPG